MNNQDQHITQYIEIYKDEYLIANMGDLSKIFDYLKGLDIGSKFLLLAINFYHYQKELDLDETPYTDSIIFSLDKVERYSTDFSSTEITQLKEFLLRN